ncbi:hypothetical protein BJY00DRAFT_129019 [Aspergillus carlsbadensis]|nr:hypothetical protein BJY00DRAFT_129019 [Aspergillus carlsbadensis]
MASKDYKPIWIHTNSPEKTNGIPVSQPEQDRSMHAAPDDEVEIFDIEDLPTNSHGNFPSAQPVKPYEIEEPDDDTASETQESSLPQQEQTRFWDDLVGSMQDLYCDSDTNNPVTMYPSKGRKRKPSNMATSHSQSGEARLSTSGRDAQNDEPSLNPKRRRRKGKPPKDHEYSRTTQEQRIRAAEQGGGSSSETLSGDTSGTNIASGCTTADEMDID